jgi:hypothetical protein
MSVQDVTDFNPFMDMNSSGFVYAFSPQYKPYSVKVKIITSIISCKQHTMICRFYYILFEVLLFFVDAIIII